MTLAFVGDSLLDTGNLDALLDPISPYPAPPYSEGKASNGLVLGEAIAQEFGIAPESIVLGFRLPPTPGVDPLEQNVNYAVAGSATDQFGSLGNELENVPIGLQTQVDVFTFDLINAGALTAPADEKPDVILSAGGNDVFDALVDLPAFAAILISPGKNDDKALMRDIVSDVVSNIEQAIASIEDLVDDIVITGIPKLGDTPFAIQVDNLVAFSFGNDIAGKTRDFLTATSAEINAQLDKIYDGKSPKQIPGLQGFSQLISDGSNQLLSGLEALVADFTDDPLLGGALGKGLARVADFVDDTLLNWDIGHDPVENVMVIDAISVFEAGLDNWQASLPAPLTPITDISYRDYLEQLGSGNPNQLPTNLVVDQFAFIDGVHPTEAFNLELASLAAAQIKAEFCDFG